MSSKFPVNHGSATSCGVLVYDIRRALELKGKLDEVGSIAYLSELAEGVVSAANGEYYASIIKRDSLTEKSYRSR